jgi:hypothetical protein
LQPVIILGAPRSGTNILRDSIANLSKIATWDCDEIPYIWRYGNKKYPTDLLTSEMANTKIKNYIRNEFEKISLKYKKDYILEKTCANTLRVNFVNKIFPEAKFINIIRNGLDVTHSIITRWESKFSLSYTLKKLKYVPKVDIPYYGIQFLKNRVYKKVNNNRLKLWGPIFLKEEELKNLTLEEIASLQWVSCVQNAKDALNNIKEEKIFNIKYEDFVVAPHKSIKNLSEFIGITYNDSLLPSISKSNIGKGLKSLSFNQKKIILPLIINTMNENNYPCSLKD